MRTRRWRNRGGRRTKRWRNRGGRTGGGMERGAGPGGRGTEDVEWVQKHRRYGAEESLSLWGNHARSLGPISDHTKPCPNLSDIIFILL